ncbi:TlpA disulfide reductase family protein [Fulvivirgaceae bacterium BMA12]|uniref:TlpA disulfide reductase family protein n=1 Tax=Agaribacillus aureus TaxID=3051825 RepID=A0ABT8LB12_9BACT|nr:TlpA disulfide reductase family protein [Fulvivirgaceae bacterium BMA12]
MKAITYILAPLLIISACNSQPAGETGSSDVIISGKVNNTSEGDIVIESIVEQQFQPVKTIQLQDDNTFSDKLTVTEPNLYRINFFNKQFAFLILDEKHSEVSVTADGDRTDGFIEIKGSKDTDYLREIQEIRARIGKVAEEINPAFMKANQEGDKEAMEQLQLQYMNKQKEINDQVKDKVREMGNSLTAVLVTQELNPDEDFAFMEEMAQKFSQTLPNSFFTKQLVEKVNSSKKFAIGQVAPEITLEDPDGNMVSLSSLKGNYVMIDFWAAWCRPCRAENPNVVALYNKYNAKGFEVFGVSLDRKKEDWVAAIEKDGLSWTHVSDLQYFNSAAARLYNIQAIPATYLLDKEGRIIGKNLRGAALRKKLEEIFDGA